MSIFNRFNSEFIDIIEWTQTDGDTMVYRFPRYKNEIKYGSKLTVREGQAAVLINEGTLADVFTPGIYELKTANLPILSTLQNWQHGFESPFKAEVYFFNTTDFLNIKWGTKQSVVVQDSEFGIVRLKAFGSYTMRIHNPKTFLRKVVGTDGNFEIEEISGQLTNIITSYFPEVLAESGISILHLAIKYSELAEILKLKVSDEFSKYGLELGTIYIENVSLPSSVQKAIDEKAGMNIIGDDIDDYTKYKAAKSLGEEGSANSAISAGVGVALGAEMAKDITNSNANSGTQEAINHPHPALEVYYIMLLGKRIGPMTLKDIYSKLAADEITPNTMIWRSGFHEWQPIKKTDDIDLSLLPPPPPVKSPIAAKASIAAETEKKNTDKQNGMGNNN